MRKEHDRTATLRAWIDLGKRLGLCSDAYCFAHGALLTDAEAEAAEEGMDPCLIAVRLWDADHSVTEARP